MRRGTIIVLIFAIVVAAVLLLSRFLQTQPPVTLRVAVSPLIESWAREAVDAYNATDPILNTQRIRFTVELVDDTAVWLDEGSARRTWTTENHPVAWIPAWSTSVTYAAERLPFETITPSLARTTLVWGGFQSRVNALFDGGVPFGWERIGTAAAAGRWGEINPAANLTGNLRLAFNRPTQTMSGLAVLLNGAAAFNDVPSLTGQTLLGDTRNFLQPVLESVPNFNTLGAFPAQRIAASGSSVAEVALLPESEWLKNLSGTLINAADPVVFAYPDIPFTFDFPFAFWDQASNTTGTLSVGDTRTAVSGLSAWLTSADRQARLYTYGLRQIAGDPPESAALFAAGERYGIVRTFDISEPIQAPARSDLQRLIEWATNYIR